MRDLLAELLPRWLAVWLGIRRLTPVGDYWPRRSTTVEPIADTGGTFRAAWRQQDPAVDPREPNGGESSSVGNDHGWSGCTMTAGALAIAYQQPRGGLAPWGGDMRHRQTDLAGGTDLYDLRTAWSAYGEQLNIRSGAGWSELVEAHDQGRAIVVQGSGNVPGAETFDGGHACAIAPETQADGDWLFGDPLATGWQWVTPSSIRSWAERWQSSIAFATGELPPSSPPDPDPVPQPPAPAPCPDCPDPQPAIDLAVTMDDDADVQLWVAYLRAGEPSPADAWSVGAWHPAPASLAVLEADCGELGGAKWARGPLPDPVASAYVALTVPPAWSTSPGRAALWD
jgi:hypothetical protein